MDTDVGRVGKPTGLSQAEPEEVSALSGFDPSRAVQAKLIQPTITVENEGYDGPCTGDRYIWVRHDGHPEFDALLATVHYNYAYHDNGTIGSVAERVADVIRGREPAIAIETRRAETENTGSVATP